MNIEFFIILAGVFQLILVIVSLAIPSLLSWKQGLEKTTLLIRQMFWTYSIYIWFFNLSFALLSIFASKHLVEGNLLSFIITLFIGVYWLGRIIIQFFYFSREGFPEGVLYSIGEFLLVSLFGFLTVIYFYVAYHNYIILQR